jgi:hypothetical protein
LRLPPSTWIALAEEDAATRQAASERRREQHASVQACIDVVLYDLLAEHGFADDFDVDPQVGIDAGLPEVGSLFLRVGEESERNDRSDVYRRRRVLRVHNDFVGARGIRHAALDDRDAILVEELSVDAAGDSCDIDRDVAVGCQHGAIGAGVAPDLLDVRQPRDSPDELRVETRPVRGTRPGQAGQNREVGGSGVGQVRGERRLRPPRRGYRTHRETADQPDEEHDRRQTAPPATERRPEPVPGHAQDLPHHSAV